MATLLDGEPFHIHLGTGSLGLGFVGYLAHRAALRVILANRRGSRSDGKNWAIERHKEYTVYIDRETSTTEQVPVAELIYMDWTDELIRWAVNPSTILLTTALKEGLEDCVPLISEMASARVQAKLKMPLFVMACENRLDSLWLMAKVEAHLAGRVPSEELRRHVSFLPCIVDRICSRAGLDELSGKAVVHVESYMSWVIQEGDHSGILADVLSPLTNQGVVEFVRELRPYKIRKLWLVNGPHLLAAVLAKGSDKAGVNLFLRDGANEEIFKRIQQEFTEGVLISTAEFSRRELDEFNKRIRVRFREYPDTIGRVLSRFQRETLEKFWIDLDAKVGAPARLVLRKRPDANMRWTSSAVYEAIRMVAEGDYVQV